MSVSSDRGAAKAAPTAADHANTVRELSEEAALALIEHGAEDADDRHAAICDAVDALKTQAETADRERQDAYRAAAKTAEKLVAAEAERDHARDALRQYDEAFTAARGSIAFYMGPNARVGVSRQTIAMFTALADASVVARAALGDTTAP